MNHRLKKSLAIKPHSSMTGNNPIELQSKVNPPSSFIVSVYFLLSDGVSVNRKYPAEMHPGS